MESRDNELKCIKDFLSSDKKCMLVKGTDQFKKHIFIMSVLNQLEKNTKILYRTNGIDNAFSNPNNLGKLCKKKKRAGELFFIDDNIYAVDSFCNRGTWNKTYGSFDYAIVYPIDPILRGDIDSECIANLFDSNRINKIFLVTWTDKASHDYNIINKYIDETLIYDAEDIDYHNRVKNNY